MITLTRESLSARQAAGDTVSAEQYDALVQWVRSLDDTADVEATTIGVTSCTHGAGVSTVAASLAVAAAQNCDRPVLLVDLSSTRPLLAAQLAVSDDLGLRKALASDEPPSQFVAASAVPNLSLLAVQEPGTSQTPTNDGRKLSELLRGLKRDFGFIVVDLPPSDSCLCFALSGVVGGVLLVVEAERTAGDAAARAVQRLALANATVLGVILNKYSRDLPSWLRTRI